jgi:ATP-binding cassette subfamily C protein
VFQISLALVVSLVEALGALLILFLLTNITQPGNSLKLPVVGDLRLRFPGVSQGTIFLYVSLGVTIFFLMRAALVLTQSYLQARLVFTAGAWLSSRLFRIYLSHDLAWHLRRNSAELVRNASESVALIVANVFIPVVGIATDWLLVTVVGVVLITRVGLLSVIATCVLLTFVVTLTRVLQPRYTAVGAVNEETTEHAIRLLQEGFAGIRDIKMFGAATYFERDLKRTRLSQAHALSRRGLMIDTPRPVVETVIIVLILAFLASQRVVGSSTQESLPILGLFAYAVLRIMPALNRMVSNIGMVQFGAAAVGHVAADLGEDHRRDGPHVGVSLSTPFRLQKELKVEHVSLCFAERGAPALNNVSMRVKAGESVGLVGPTGCGKTTLIDVVTGLLQPEAGRVVADGEDINHRVREWQTAIGLVPQAVFLLDDTIRRNIAFGVDDDDVEEPAVEQAIRLAQLEGFVHDLPQGLDTVVGDRGVRLSGGQRQRVAVARALYPQPSVVIFDEGTSALDNLTEADLVRELELLRGERTIITVAHRLSTVRNCDRIYVMGTGRIVGEGSWNELLEASEEFRRLAAATASALTH